MPEILITICCRGGSRGIPGKNIRLLNGKPLIAYTIESAKKFAASCNGTIILSTDSQEIKDVARDFGLTTEYLRPDELATDIAGKTPVLQHALQYMEAKTGKQFEVLLDMDVTSPLRTQADLGQGLDKLMNNENALNIFSVNPSSRNPYFNMVEEDADGFVTLSKPPKTPIYSRQTAPKVYDMNASFYFFKRAFFEQGFTTPIIPNKSLIYAMPHVCFDLDEPLDFEFMEYLFSCNKLTFEI
jgi:CMP-N-acetylneuraminic acid synthetase